MKPDPLKMNSQAAGRKVNPLPEKDWEMNVFACSFCAEAIGIGAMSAYMTTENGFFVFYRHVSLVDACPSAFRLKCVLGLSLDGSFKTHTHFHVVVFSVARCVGVIQLVPGFLSVELLCMCVSRRKEVQELPVSILIPPTKSVFSTSYVVT